MTAVVPPPVSSAIPGTRFVPGGVHTATGDLDPQWAAALEPLAAGGAIVTLSRGWDVEWERAARSAGRAAGCDVVSVRFGDDEVLVGPRWVPGADHGCAGCAELRERAVLDHPLLEMPELAGSRPTTGGPALAVTLAVAVRSLTGDGGLAPGQLCAVGPRGVRRHMIRRSVHCPLCGRTASAQDPEVAPPAPVPCARPASADDPSRAAAGAALVAPGALRDTLVDGRFGPVQGLMRDIDTPFAVTIATLPDSAAWGYGRGATLAGTEPVAIIEAYERLGGFPFDAPVLLSRRFDEVAGHALDPATLGQFTDEQLAHPTCKIMRPGPDTAFDWVWGHDLATGDATLVPAEIGFFNYEYRFRHARRAARRAGPAAHRKHFHESSSGSAAGSCREEATLHSLFELAERDAFLMSWHRARPLPEIDPASLDDPETRALLDLLDARGYDVHVLVATWDIELPIFWVLAVARDDGMPASWSSGGSGADPGRAVRSALREVAQLATMEPNWDVAEFEAMLDDPWRLEELEQHSLLFTLPEMRDRVLACTGGPTMRLDERFPGWPDVLRERGGDDVRGALEHVRGMFAGVGLDRVVVVDQTTREHAFAGISVVKSVVPGVVPMCFGYAQQRLVGLPRFTAAIRGTAAEHRVAPYDPHPFA